MDYDDILMRVWYDLKSHLPKGDAQRILNERIDVMREKGLPRPIAAPPGRAFHSGWFSALEAVAEGVPVAELRERFGGPDAFAPKDIARYFTQHLPCALVPKGWSCVKEKPHEGLCTIEEVEP